MCAPTVPKECFSNKKLDNFRSNTGVSVNSMKIFANFIRSTVGRKSLPANYSKHMSEKSTILKNLYHTAICEFECKDSVEKRPVVFADAEALLDAVVEKRGFIGNILIKAMADGGQGFFKIF